METEWGRVDKKLANEQFLAKAPEAVVVKERERAEELRATLEKLRTNLGRVTEAA